MLDIIVNRAFGGISSEAAKHRCDPKWVERVKQGYHGQQQEWTSENLQIISIPESAIDWQILQYDGKEGVVYSDQWGDLHFIGCEDLQGE